MTGTNSVLSCPPSLPPLVLESPSLAKIQNARKFARSAFLYSEVQIYLQEAGWIPAPGSLWLPVRVSKRNMHFRVLHVQCSQPTTRLLACPKDGRMATAIIILKRRRRRFGF